MNYSQHPLDNKLLLGRYRVIRLLGEGGMGTVHLARVEGAEGFTRPVVVKRMKRDIQQTEAGNRLFIREAKILSRLQHPGIVGISDFGVENGAHIMVLEYVHGYTLSPWLEYRKRLGEPMPADICMFIIRRVLDALHYAHHFDTQEGQEVEIVHRDISPDNILLNNKGYVHLLDFGIASMRGPAGEGATKSVGFRGKLCYAGPETVQGQPATPHSDQYSAAIVLLELLSGETPFESDSIAESFSRMVHEPAPKASQFRGDLPPGLDAVLDRALSKDPLKRFKSALAFSKELRRFQSQDDEDIGEALTRLVAQDFQRLPEALGVEALSERETALQRILSQAPEAIAATQVEAISPGLNATVVERRPPLATAATIESLPPPASGQRQLHGLLWGLLVVGGLIALGLGAAVALLSRGGNAGDQVVIVGGDQNPAQTAGNNEAESKAQSPDIDNPNPDTAAPERIQLPAAAQRPPQSGASSSGQIPKSGHAAPSQSKSLERAVQGQSGAFQACFAKHLEQAKKQPKAVLHFSVARSGGSAQVKVEPSSLAATPLGTCLRGAARGVRFPKQPSAVAFRVPVRARVSKSKGLP